MQPATARGAKGPVDSQTWGHADTHGRGIINQTPCDMYTWTRQYQTPPCKMQGSYMTLAIVATMHVSHAELHARGSTCCMATKPITSPCWITCCACHCKPRHPGRDPWKPFLVELHRTCACHGTHGLAGVVYRQLSMPGPLHSYSQPIHGMQPCDCNN